MHHRGPYDRPVLGPAVEFLVRPPRPVHLREPDLDDQLVGRERGFEKASEEVGCRDRPFASGTAHDDVGIERERDRRQVGGRIAVRERTAQRAAVAHLRVADERGGVAEQWYVFGQHR